MKTIKFKYLTLIFVAIILATVGIFVLCSQNAFAWTTNQWRPSIELKKSIDYSTARINECNAALEYSANFIEEYEQNSADYEKNVNTLQVKYDDMKKFIQEQRPELEEVVKNSYATFFAKDLLDEIVGNSFITNGLFRWGFITMVAAGEDDEVREFVDEYLQTEKDLEVAINERDNASLVYQQSLDNMKNMPNEIIELNKNIENCNNLLPQILEIESVYGAAGESRIEGTNIFCHPCPDSQLSSHFGEARDGYVHHGVDFSTSYGSPIYAAADGIVFETGQNDSMGNYIKIQHAGGLVTVYMHCSHIFVPNNMSICKGDNIALVGSTGDSNGPHLHFQVELNGTPVNGLNYM